MFLLLTQEEKSAPLPPKGGYVLRHENNFVKIENEPPFRGVGGQKNEEGWGIGWWTMMRKY
jgi:hypothetical protein